MQLMITDMGLAPKVLTGHHLSDIGQSIDVRSFHLQENFLTFVCFHRFT